MTDHARAIEAGARAMEIAMNSFERDVRVDSLTPAEHEYLAKVIITAAIASGALVPASADNTTLATSATNRIAKVVSMSPETRDDVHGIIQETLAGLAPASGDYVVVPRIPTQAMVEAGWDAANRDIGGDVIGTIEIQSVIGRTVWSAMLHAASRTGGGK